MRIQTIATSVALTLALVGAAQAETPRGDSNNVPFQGVEASTISRDEINAQLNEEPGAEHFRDLNNEPFQAS